ncbi:MAG: nitronate monooxygenase [Woeseiaceae bacterium]
MTASGAKAVWPRNELIDLLKVDLPIIQSPMAGASGADMAVAVCNAGGLGSLPCAMLPPSEVRAEVATIRSHTSKPLNTNFFCHIASAPDSRRDRIWRERLARYYRELHLERPDSGPSSSRAPFDAAMCEVVEETKPDVVSFHFGLPDNSLIGRVKACGAVIISSATTVEEARWLEEHGCDAIIAQGCEAGGHRAMFLAKDVAAQVGTFALVPQVVDAVAVPVIAAGGISDGRGIAAAFALGASGVQVGTAYLMTQESLITDVHRKALRSARDDMTVLTNVFSGRPARGIINRIVRELGPMSDLTPQFPAAGAALAPLKARAESNASGDFSALWSGQAAALAHETSAAELTQSLADDAQRCLSALAP